MGWFRRDQHPEDEISAYLDGELDASGAFRVEKHLESCTRCSALLEELREAKSIVSALPQPSPGRSFVLGPEYARRSRSAPTPQRSAWVLVPAIALSVFAALLAVDVGGFTASEHQSALTAANKTTDARQAHDSAAGSAPAQAPSLPDAAAAGSSGAAANSAPAPSSGPSTFSQPAAGETQAAGASLSAEQAPSPASAGHSTQSSADRGSGPSTLRLLEIVAGIAFALSAVMVFVWPRPVGR